MKGITPTRRWKEIHAIKRGKEYNNSYKKGKRSITP